MKKFYAFGLMLAMAGSVSAQGHINPKLGNTQSAKYNPYTQQVIHETIAKQGKKPTMVPGAQKMNSTEEELGVTVYDLQTNGSVCPRIIADDNGVAATFTFSAIEGGGSYSDRGTGYNFRSASTNTWEEFPSSRIENVRTGWSNLLHLSNGSEMVISHNGVGGLKYVKRDAVGTGNWSTISEITTASGEAILWPRATNGGDDGNSVHVIGITDPNNTINYNGLGSCLLYYRSTDGGATWDVTDGVLPEMNSNYSTGVTADTYAIHARGNTIVISVFGELQDSYIFVSEDNGTTWTKTVFWDFPIDNYDIDMGTDIEGDGIQDTILSSDGTGSLYIDVNNNIHIAFGTMFYTDDLGVVDSSYSYFPLAGSIAYWNSNMTPELVGQDSIIVGQDSLFAYNQSIYSNDIDFENSVYSSAESTQTLTIGVGQHLMGSVTGAPEGIQWSTIDVNFSSNNGQGLFVSDGIDSIFFTSSGTGDIANFNWASDFDIHFYGNNGDSLESLSFVINGTYSTQEIVDTAYVIDTVLSIYNYFDVYDYIELDSTFVGQDSLFAYNETIYSNEIDLENSLYNLDTLEFPAFLGSGQEMVHTLNGGPENIQWSTVDLDFSTIYDQGLYMFDGQDSVYLASSGLVDVSNLNWGSSIDIYFYGANGDTLQNLDFNAIGYYSTGEIIDTVYLIDTVIAVYNYFDVYTYTGPDSVWVGQDSLFAYNQTIYSNDIDFENSTYGISQYQVTQNIGSANQLMANVIATNSGTVWNELDIDFTTNGNLGVFVSNGIDSIYVSSPGLIDISSLNLGSDFEIYFYGENNGVIQDVDLTFNGTYSTAEILDTVYVIDTVIAVYDYFDVYEYVNIFNYNNSVLEIGVSPDTDTTIPTAITEVGQYGNSGIASHPQIAGDAAGNIYVAYSAINELYFNGEEYLRHVFAVKSEDTGFTWSDPADITPDFAEVGWEYMFASMAHEVYNDKLHLVIQKDEEPGVHVQPEDVADPVGDNIQIYLAISTDLVPSFNEGVDALGANAVMAYPNPTSTAFTLVTESFVGGQLAVYDAMGRVVMNDNLNTGKTNINVSTWNKGVYHIVVRKGNASYQTSLVVE